MPPAYEHLEVGLKDAQDLGFEARVPYLNGYQVQHVARSRTNSALAMYLLTEPLRENETLVGFLGRGGVRVVEFPSKGVEYDLIQPRAHETGAGFVRLGS